MTECSSDDLNFMQRAMEQASLAAQKGEVPVGAIIVHNGEIIAQAHNLRESSQDPLAHAELLAIREAAQALGHWRLLGTSLYVTLEPCPMCAGAIVNSRISRVVFGASDPRAGACGSIYNIVEDERLNHRPELLGGVLKEPCSTILSEFFAALRKSSKGT